MLQALPGMLVVGSADRLAVSMQLFGNACWRCRNNDPKSSSGRHGCHVLNECLLTAVDQPSSLRDVMRNRGTWFEPGPLERNWDRKVNNSLRTCMSEPIRL